MFKFFSDAKQELEHVVWPTPNETKKYMYYTVGVIVIMAFLLAVAGYVMQTSLSSMRTALDMGKEVTTTTSGEENVTQEDLSNIIDSFSGITTDLSGSVSNETN